MPLSNINTTNHVERCFGVLKYVLKMNNRKKIPMESAVIQIVQWAENKFICGSTDALRKDMSIYHPDPIIQGEYSAAAAILNKSGCLALKKTIELLEKYEDNMSFDEACVVETSALTGSEKGLRRQYQTTDLTCDCSFRRKNLHVCRHILFLRRSLNLPLFDPETFSDYYKKADFEKGDERLDIQKQAALMSDSSVEVSSNNDSDEEIVTFSHNEKFRICRSSLSDLEEIMPKFGTQQFIQYMWELEIIKKRIREGKNILRESPQSHANSKEVSDIKAVDPSDDKHDSPLNKEVNWLQFERCLKRRGRPKKKPGRVQFNQKKGLTGKKRLASKGIKLSSKKPKMTDIIAHDDEIRSMPSKLVALIATNSALNCNLVKVESSVVTDSVAVSSKKVSMSESITICCLPPLHGQIGENAVSYADYTTLMKGRFITGSLLNWNLKVLCNDFPNPEVTVLSTDVYQRLEFWSDEYQDERLLTWVDQVPCLIGDNRLVILPSCCRSHFYILVAVMDPSAPVIFILESLGGPYYGQEPPFTDKFVSFLNHISKRSDSFEKLIPEVPRQPFSSNNCGFFAIKFVELILQDPAAFVALSRSNSLGDWFGSQSLNNKRQEIASLVAKHAEDQRLIPLPLPSPDEVYHQVFGSQ